MNSISWRGQMSSGLVIGLLPDTWYTVNLQALNMAGMSQISETDYQLTLKMGISIGAMLVPIKYSYKLNFPCF